MSDQQEGMEAMAGKWMGSLKGEKGERGEKGASQLPFRQAYAIVFLFVLNLLFVGICFWWLAGTVSSNNATRCTSISEIVGIPVPIPVAGNPSREAWARFEQVERQRGNALGCKMPPPRYAQTSPGN